MNNSKNNSQTVNKDNDSKKIFTMLIMVFTLMICTTSATYAYFALNATNNVISGTAATANLTLAVSKIQPTATGSGALVPQYSYYGSTNTLKNAIDVGCVDTNNNLICQVYTIVLTNSSTSNIKVDGSFTLTAANMTNLKWYTIASGTGTAPTTTYTYPTTTTQYGNLKDVTTLGTNISINSGASYYYVVAVWIEETGEAQTDSGTFNGVISFNSSGGGGVTSTITS